MTERTVLPHTKEILPGLTLTVLPTDRFKVGRFCLFLPQLPDRREEPLRSLLMGVLCRGCEGHPTKADIDRYLDELYDTPFGPINSSQVGYHCLGFEAGLLEDRYLLDGTDLCSRVLELMAKLLFCPRREENGGLLSHYVASERQHTVDELRSLKNRPAAYAHHRFLTHFYGADAPLVFLQGSEQEVERITAAELTALHRRICDTSPIRCFYVGGMDEKVLTDKLRRVFAPYLSRRSEVRVLTPSPVPMRPCHGEVRYVEEQDEAGQSHLFLGFCSGITMASPDFYAMMLCQELLGVSPISRLFVYVREAESLCYSCRSVYNNATGDVLIFCGISAENRTRAEEAILAQITALQKGDFTEAEWQAARKSLTGGYRQLADSAKSLMSFYERRALAGLDQTAEGCRAAFLDVTREQVMAAAAKMKLQLVYFRRGTGGTGGEEDEDA